MKRCLIRTSITKLFTIVAVEWGLLTKNIHARPPNTAMNIAKLFVSALLYEQAFSDSQLLEQRSSFITNLFI